MAIPKIQITGKVLLPNGAIPSQGSISIKLHTPGVTADGEEIGGRQVFVLGSDGSLPASLLLTPNAAIVPESWYDVTIRVMEASGGAYRFPDEKWSIVAGTSSIAIDDVLRINGTPPVVYGPDPQTLAARDAAVAAAAQAAVDVAAAVAPKLDRSGGDASATLVLPTGASTPRTMADHLATLPDAKVTATGTSTTKSLADWMAIVASGGGGTSPPPAAPSIMAPANAAVTAQSSVTLRGIGDPNTTTRVFREGALVATAPAGTFGEWEAASVALTSGSGSSQTVDSFAVDSLSSYTLTGTWTISAGRLHNNTSENPAIAARNSPTFANGDIAFIGNVADWAKRVISLRLRHTDNNNAIIVQVDGRAGTPTIQIYDQKSGAYTQLGAMTSIAAPANGVDVTLKAAVSGTALSVWWNGTLVATRTTTITASGKACLSCGTWSGQAAEVQFDDLVINTETSGAISSLFTASSSNANGVSGLSPNVLVVPGTPPAISFAAIGDSITAEPGFGGVTSWPAVLLAALPAGSTKNNVAVSGQTSSDQLVEFHDHVIGAAQAWLVTFVGTNDARLGTVPKETTIANLRHMWTDAVAAGKKVIAVTILPHKNETYGMWSAQIQADQEWVNAAIRADCRANGYQLVDGYALFGSAADRAVLNPAYANADGIHLNQAGENYLAGLILGVLVP